MDVAQLLRVNLALGFLAAGLVDRAGAVLGPLPDDVTVDEAPAHHVQACLDTAQGRPEAAARRLDHLPQLPGHMLLGPRGRRCRCPA